MNSKTTTLPEPGPALPHVAPSDTLSPAERYQELFVDVQMGGIFDDCKTFVDCVPSDDPARILERYRREKSEHGFDLSRFVRAHFECRQIHESHYQSDPDQSLTDHIDTLWDVLTRHPHEHPAHSSLLPLPYDYVVPGGRFDEMYYWDSYFTMLGLAESGRPHLLRTMANNFAYLIDTYGHVPNGTRTYYLSRSQPPVFALMVKLLEDRGVGHALDHLPQLKREYAFWMRGAQDLKSGDAHEHVVRLDDGSLLNRYWDLRAEPREESYREDVATAARSSRPADEVYRDLRAAAASGWDFSTRWLDGADDLATIRTTSLAPVDLNAFMFTLEHTIAHLARRSGDLATAETFDRHAESRRKAISQHMWDAREGAFFDLDIEREQCRQCLTAAAAVPLFTGLATQAQADASAQTLRQRLLQEGGLGTTEYDSHEQWDRPNGWAPLQWMAVMGLRRYGEMRLADSIAHRWLHTVGAVYEHKAKLVEKYVLHEISGQSMGGGGEYPLQDGFGWTNGVTRRLLHEDPRHHAHGCRAGRVRPRS
ncbi:alpha,alpha-trehalase TreF [Oleiagrimonas sp. C23AA]|uniref:alpha,alpha-trehalase TreF n=1 Tax=Oleiagrimonas sp. C23AA TaxID=2719047 RepID=UPI001423D122|nr:alpha,alpha-trehalase TreF [Oleiagrimonas sp. C23AA]NII12233.1 alpha,alpha-trehalase TreF [Oleiagrimonas sp. C23AA]